MRFGFMEHHPKAALLLVAVNIGSERWSSSICFWNFQSRFRAAHAGSDGGESLTIVGPIPRFGGW
jgi:hypothetical protein